MNRIAKASFYLDWHMIEHQEEYDELRRSMMLPLFPAISDAVFMEVATKRVFGVGVRAPRRAPRSGNK